MRLLIEQKPINHNLSPTENDLDLQKAIREASHEVDMIATQLEDFGQKSAAKRFIALRDEYLQALELKDALIDIAEMVRLIKPSVKYFRQVSQESLRNDDGDETESPHFAA